MTARRDKLQGLRIESPCPTSWESMQGDERRRHCLQCDKPVYDFAQLTPREVSGLIEACRGNFCARLTRDGRGQLITLQPPPAVIEPLASRRVSPLVTAAVMAVLGLSSTAWADPATPVSPAAEQGDGEQARDTRPQRPGKTGSSLSGTLTSEAGEPAPNAEIRLYNQLDRQERTRRTDADGRFSFASVTAGIYELEASVGERQVAQQGDILLSAGEQRQIGLTIPPDVWQSIVAGEDVRTITVGGAGAAEEPMHSLYEEAGVVVLAVAGESVTVQQQKDTSVVRTELVISSRFKGDTQERVISVYHEQRPNEDPASRLQPGDNVLAFLNPRETEKSRDSDGYVAAHALSGLRELPDAELKAYRQRIEALAEIPERGIARPAELLEWLVATTEDPITRKEAVGELSGAVQLLEQQASERKILVDHHAADVRDVFTDFLSGGGTLPEGGVHLVILAAFLTDAHRERLTKALLSTTHATAADIDLYDLVSPWQADPLVPWLIDRLKTAELERGSGRRLMASLAEALDDEGLADLLAAGEEPISDIEMEFYSTDDGAAQQRLGKQLDTAEEELRRHFVAALGRRR